MYIYIYMYICIYIYVYIHTFEYIFIYIHSWGFTCLSIWVNTYTPIRKFNCAAAKYTYVFLFSVTAISFLLLSLCFASTQDKKRKSDFILWSCVSFLKHKTKADYSIVFSCSNRHKTMGWLRLVRPIIFRSLLIVATLFSILNCLSSKPAIPAKHTCVHMFSVNERSCSLLSCVCLM